MNTYQHFKTSSDEHGILWLTLDVQNESANVLSVDVITELSQFISEIGDTNAKALVIQSGKSSGFIAGADIKHFQKVENQQQALSFIEQGQALCQQIEDLTIPTLALIDGFCLGGGMELALACDYRIASDRPATKLGLPEVKLGIHPGFGGSVRSIQVMGVISAMTFMLKGSPIGAYQAKRMGLIDLVVPQRQLIESAIFHLQKQPKKHKANCQQRLLNHAPFRFLVSRFLQRETVKKVNRKHYPAPFALIELWEKHGHDLKVMYKQEALSVAKLINTETAQNLVRVFFLQTRLKALGNKKDFTPEHIHVIGGGAMGGDIAAWCAMQGMRVTIQDMRAEALANVLQRASTYLQKRFKHDSISFQTIMDRLIPDLHGHGVKKADVIIEAIFENLQAKQEVFHQVEQQAKSDAILATNTSSIPLDEISVALKEPSRLIGLHFFNPVMKMPLLEVVHEPEMTDQAVIQKALAFAVHIKKLPLPVKSSPGFLVNRVLMPYLMESILLHQQGVPAEVIDEAATDFGMPMGPLALGDTVGLDICLHVGEILAEKMALEVPESLKNMVAEGHLGKKSGQGFYTYVKGKQSKSTDIEPIKWQGNKADIQQRIIGKLLNEAQACLNETIADDANLIDAGVIFGTGFAPFRGGPLFYQKTT